MTYQLIQGDATRIPLADASVDAVIASPPYAEARTYSAGFDLAAERWAEWMTIITIEALRVTRGAVIWVVDDQVKGHRLRPGVSLLCVELYRRGVIQERSLIWRSNKAPSRKGLWWCHTWEHILAFKRHPSPLPYFDWMATGTPVKYGYAGAFRQRNKNGQRPSRYRPYVSPKYASPRDVIYAKVGGGHMGHPLATKNEAPYPESLISQILPVIVPPGGVVLDCFSGSGTTIAAALALGRNAIGIDLRMSQCELARERISNPVMKRKSHKTQAPAVKQFTMFPEVA